MAKGSRFQPQQALQYVMGRLQQLGVPQNLIGEKAQQFVNVMYQEGAYIGVTQGSPLDQYLQNAAAQAEANRPRGLPQYQNPAPGAPVAPSHEPAARVPAYTPPAAAPNQPNRGMTAHNPHPVPVNAPVMNNGSDQPEGMTDVPPAPVVEY